MNKIQKTMLAVTVIALVLSFVSFLSTKAALVGNTTQATLSLSPQSGAYNINDTFPVSVNVNTNGRNIVTVAAYLNYNPAVFQAVSTDLTGSVFTTNFENVIDATMATSSVRKVIALSTDKAAAPEAKKEEAAPADKTAAPADKAAPVKEATAEESEDSEEDSEEDTAEE